MTEEEAIALRRLCRQRYPEIAAFWQNIGRQAHWELTVEGLCGHDPQRLLPALMPVQLTDFAHDFLRSFETATGLTYEQLASDYGRLEATIEVEAYLRHKAYFERQARDHAALQAWARPFFDRVYHQVVHELALRVLLPYDPQHLLTDQRK